MFTVEMKCEQHGKLAGPLYHAHLIPVKPMVPEGPEAAPYRNFSLWGADLPVLDEFQDGKHYRVTIEPIN